MNTVVFRCAWAHEFYENFITDCISCSCRRRGEGAGGGYQRSGRRTGVELGTFRTLILQGDPPFRAKYSGPNSLDNHGEVRETVSLDLYGGVRLWPGAEAYADGLMWQGFGLSQTRGVDGFPNGEAFRTGNDAPNVNLARLFIRQNISLGSEQESVEDDQLQLAEKREVSRITLTLGKLSVKDIFDNNAYANDPRTQFMNWALMANEAWDYPADSIGSKPDLPPS